LGFELEKQRARPGFETAHAYQWRVADQFEHGGAGITGHVITSLRTFALDGQQPVTGFSGIHRRHGFAWTIGRDRLPRNLAQPTGRLDAFSSPATTKNIISLFPGSEQNAANTLAPIAVAEEQQ